LTLTFDPAGNFTIVECPWSSRYTKAWSSPGNDPSCASAAPTNVTVESDAVGAGPDAVGTGSLVINLMPAVTIVTDNGALQVMMGQGVPLQGPTLYSGVVVRTGATPLDLLLQNVDVTWGGNSGVVPVIIKSGSNICKFGYKCIDGSCLVETKNQYSNQCMEYGFETPPTPCTALGNGTGMHCGMNCTSLTCTTMCPAFDCSMARGCQTGDLGVYPCHQCQCPSQCNTKNGGPRAAPGLFLFFVGVLFC